MFVELSSFTNLKIEPLLFVKTVFTSFVLFYWWRPNILKMGETVNRIIFDTVHGFSVKLHCQLWTIAKTFGKVWLDLVRFG
jgi:hypothetical protein